MERKVSSEPCETTSNGGTELAISGGNGVDAKGDGKMDGVVGVSNGNGNALEKPIKKRQGSIPVDTIIGAGTSMAIITAYATAAKSRSARSIGAVLTGAGALITAGLGYRGTLLVQQKQALKKSCKSLRKENDMLRDEAEAILLKLARDGLQGNKRSLRDMVDALYAAHGARGDEILRLRDEVKRLQAELAEVKDSEANAQATVAKLFSALRITNEEKVSLAQSCERLRSEVAQQMKDLEEHRAASSKEVSMLSEQLESLKRTMEADQQEIAKLRARNHEQTEIARKVINDAQQYLHANMDLKERNQSLESELQTLKVMSKGMANELHMAKSRAVNMARMEVEMEENRGKLQQTEAKLAAALAISNHNSPKRRIVQRRNMEENRGRSRSPDQEDEVVLERKGSQD